MVILSGMLAVRSRVGAVLARRAHWQTPCPRASWNGQLLRWWCRRRFGLGLLLRRRRRRGRAGLSGRLGFSRLRRRFGVGRLCLGRLGDDGLLICRLLGCRLILVGPCCCRLVLGLLFLGLGGNVGGKRGE